MHSYHLKYLRRVTSTFPIHLLRARAIFSISQLPLFRTACNISIPPASPPRTRQCKTQGPLGTCNSLLLFQGRTQAIHVEPLTWQPHSPRVEHCYGGGPIYLIRLRVSATRAAAPHRLNSFNELWPTPRQEHSRVSCLIAHLFNR